MKIFACLCTLLAVANAGILSLAGSDGGGHGHGPVEVLRVIHLGGGHSNGGDHGGHGGDHGQILKVKLISAGGGGGGHGHGHDSVKLVRVIHQQAAPQLVRVIHEQDASGDHGGSGHGHGHAPQVIHVVHTHASDANSGSAQLSQPISPAPSPEPARVIRVIHEHKTVPQAPPAPAFVSLPAPAPSPAYLPPPASLSQPSSTYLPPDPAPAQTYGPVH